MLVWSLGQEQPLKKEMSTHSSILVWRIPWMEEPSRLQSMELQRVRHEWATNILTFPSYSGKESTCQCKETKETRIRPTEHANPIPHPLTMKQVLPKTSPLGARDAKMKTRRCKFLKNFTKVSVITLLYETWLSSKLGSKSSLQL